MSEKTCYIVGAAPDEHIDFTSQTGDLVVAADGGLAYLERLGIMPDVVLGDFDSLGYMPSYANVLPYPKEKDDTDMMLAVRYGLDKGYRNFVLYGGLGDVLTIRLPTCKRLHIWRDKARGVCC